MMPSLAASKPNLSVFQEQKAQEMKVNGFVPGRMRSRFERKKSEAERMHAPSPSPNRARTSFEAPDLASSPSSPIATVVGTSISDDSYYNPSAPVTPSGAMYSSSTSIASPAGVEASVDVSFDADVSDEIVRTVYKNEPPPDVHVVNTLEAAKRVVERLTSPALADRIFACDTEVIDIDVTRHSPCCHGQVSCFSVYCGPDVDFGDDVLQDGAPPRSMLWVDTWLDGDVDRAEEAAAIVQVFRPFFESTAHKKVWHNYSFDRHVIERMGFRCAGFDGDTMHMARLWDSSRTGRGGYSLEALTCKLSYHRVFENYLIIQCLKLL